MLAGSVLYAMCLRSWRKTVRRPAPLAFSFLQPVMWILFFGFLFQRYRIGDSVDPLRYLDFLLAGVCAMTVLFGASQSGIEILRDLQSGFLARMLRSATEPTAVIGGKILADVLRLLAQAVVIALLGAALGVRLSTNLSGVAASLAALGLFAVAFCSLSCFVALRTGAHESMATFVHLINMPLLFTSTALVPKRQMPGWLAAASDYNPLSAAVGLTRRALLFDDISAAPTVLALLGAIAVLAFALVSYATRRAARGA